MPTPGLFSWYELLTEDVGTAMRFYGATLGWTFRIESLPSGGEYVLIVSKHSTIGGIVPMPREGFDIMPETWLSYVEIFDLDDNVEKVTELGGSVIRAPIEVPGVGRVAIVRDPGGGMIGWVTSYY